MKICNTNLTNLVLNVLEAKIFHYLFLKGQNFWENNHQPGVFGGPKMKCLPHWQLYWLQIWALNVLKICWLNGFDIVSDHNPNSVWWWTVISSTDCHVLIRNCNFNESCESKNLIVNCHNNESQQIKLTTNWNNWILLFASQNNLMTCFYCSFLVFFLFLTVAVRACSSLTPLPFITSSTCSCTSFSSCSLFSFALLVCTSLVSCVTFFSCAFFWFLLLLCCRLWNQCLSLHLSLILLIF